jgi:hypothetical protein
MRVSTRPRSSMGLGTRPWRDLHCCLGVVPLLAKRLGKVTATTIGGYVARPHASEKFASLADVSFIVAPPCDFELGRLQRLLEVVVRRPASCPAVGLEQARSTKMRALLIRIARQRSRRSKYR